MILHVSRLAGCLCASPLARIFEEWLGVKHPRFDPCFEADVGRIKAGPLCTAFRPVHDKDREM